MPCPETRALKRRRDPGEHPSPRRIKSRGRVRVEPDTPCNEDGQDRATKADPEDRRPTRKRGRSRPGDPTSDGAGAEELACGGDLLEQDGRDERVPRRACQVDAGCSLEDRNSSPRERSLLMRSWDREALKVIVSRIVLRY